MADAASDPLKLIALDEDDLAVISVHLQDAVLRRSDIAFLPREMRFAVALRRFDWEGATAGQKRRRLSALHFERVTGVRSTKVGPKGGEGVLNLLAISFEPGESPAGEVLLQFSDGAAIRLTVECIEAQMKDLGPIWEAVGTPDHGEAG
jgi:hypothetical protein